MRPASFLAGTAQFAADGKGLIGEQLDAALGVEDVGDGDLLAFGLRST
jgi:hypothetical protein